MGPGGTAGPGGSAGTAASGGAAGDAGPTTASSGGAGGAGSGASQSGGSGGTSGSGGTGAGFSDPLGAHPVDVSPVTRGGTMTFTNVGAEGWWPRRLDREPGDPACDYKDGTDTWGGHCCMTEHATASSTLSPFDEEMTLILKAIRVKQLAVYQPDGSTDTAPWRRVTAWDSRGRSDNLWFTQEGEGGPEFPGDLTHDDCVGYLMQEPEFDCEGSGYYCPDDPGVLHQGFSGSKLVTFLGSMNFSDDGVSACGGDEAGHPGPWVAFVASELVRDGGRKWNGLCNCYSKTGSVGDGCGEINVFEVVMDGNEYSNREFASTGLRSFQEGHVGGAVCGSGCERSDFPADVEVVDACAQTAYEQGPLLEVGGATDGCPVWRRPDGDRYFFILLDAARRMIQVGVIHPEAIPAEADAVLPELPGSLERSSIDALLELRLPN
ncbi:MAG TPA: DUF2403 domain-containing lipoprotein [Polyangiaceae bacterium]|nr:DUF2403 domain-containing lipoprotein [Polyangiaceae bacterium]